jgi:hypothetical protein
VPIVDDAHLGPRLAQHDREVDVEGRVFGVAVVCPLEVAQRSSVRPVVPAVINARRERLANDVWHEQRHASGTHVSGGRLDRCSEIVLGRHVHDRVVDEHRVERTAESERSHVALHVLALGVDRSA